MTPHIVTSPSLDRISYKVSEAAIRMSIHRTTFKRKLLDTGRIEKNLFGGIWADDLERIQAEDIAARERKVAAKLRRVA